MRPVILRLEGEKPIPLRFDFNAICDVEERLGVPISALGSRMKQVSTMRVLLWAGSRPRFRSVREAGSVLSFDNLERVAVAITEALQEAFPSETQMDEIGGDEEEDTDPLPVGGASTTKASSTGQQTSGSRKKRSGT